MNYYLRTVIALMDAYATLDFDTTLMIIL